MAKAPADRYQSANDMLADLLAIAATLSSQTSALPSQSGPQLAMPAGVLSGAVTRVNVALLLVLALTSTAVYGIILGGWASNNKFSLMGGLRSAAQMVSYEVPLGLSIVGVLMLTQSLELEEIVREESPPGRWLKVFWPGRATE